MQIFFIRRSLVPKIRKVTYERIVVEIQPMKAETHRTYLTVGFNLIDFPGNVSTPMEDLTTLKVLLNSKIFTPGARFMMGGIKNFYLDTLLKHYEYMRLGPAVCKHGNRGPWSAPVARVHPRTTDQHKMPS